MALQSVPGGGGALAGVTQGGGAGRQQEVLEEDDYTEKIERIIERDFFPDVPRLQNRLEWLRAVNSGDPAAIRNAQMNIAARRAGVPTPLGATPMEFATPAGTPFTTASATPITARPGTGARATPSGGRPHSEVLRQVAPTDPEADRAPTQSLNQFLRDHTSEDNASFTEILEANNKRKREKGAWLYEDKNKAPALLLEGERSSVSTDGFGTGNAPDGALLGWKHTPKNHLYYHKDAVPLSTKERTERAHANTRKILHSNTRLPSSTSSTGLFSPDGSAVGTPASQAGATPGAYASVATPSMTPGADGMSPLMTWGDIESTPLRLEAEDMAEAGPTFRVPEVPARDKLARKLAASTPATVKHRVSSARRGSTPILSGLRRSSGATPGQQRGTPLSAAGQRLLLQMNGSNKPGGSSAHGSGDSLGLRASYRATGRPLSTAPSAARPSSGARPPKPAADKTPKQPPGTPGPGQGQSNLTDGLLNI